MTIKPLETCPECHGLGFIPVPGAPEKLWKCRCLVRAEIIEYLTPLYVKAEWNRDFETAPFIDRNVLFQGYGEAAFQKIVKSFLLGTVMKYLHCTVTASALIAAYYARPGADEPVSTAEGRASESYGQLRFVDLCVLYLVTDPPNRHYGAVLTALLQERNRYHRPTWIYTPNPIASATFQSLYGSAFAAVLETPELQLLQVTPTKPQALRTERPEPDAPEQGEPTTSSATLTANTQFSGRPTARAASRTK